MIHSTLRTLIIVLSLILMVLGVACRSTKATHNTTTKGTSDFYKKYSKILGIELTGNENKKLIEVCSGWLGVPYLYGGNTKKGTDCSGMVGAIYKEVYNITLYRSADDQAKNCTLINKSNLKTGDLVFFKINQKKISHSGLYIGNGKFIHASSKGVVISDLKEDYYKKYFYSGGRVKKK